MYSDPISSCVYFNFRGTFAWIDQLRLQPNGSVAFDMEPMQALSATLMSSFAWDSLVEIGYSHNFGLLRSSDSGSTRGRDAIIIT